MNKNCTRCGTRLTLENIYSCHLKSHYYICKDCYKKSINRINLKIWNKKYYLQHKEILTARAKEWQKDHRDICREASKKYKRKIRLEVLSHYSKELKCECCGESHIEFLTIDHIHGYKNSPDYNKTKKRNSSVFYTWLKRNNYPEGYRVLCFNCNLSLGFYGYCPHSK